METKKNNSKNLENKRNLFFQVGLIIALGSALAVFEMSFPEYDKEITFVTKVDPFIDEIIPITQEKKVELPTPPPAPPTEFEEIPNDVELDDDEIFINADDNPLNPMLVDLLTRQEEDIVEDIPYAQIKEKPEFKGGINAFRKFIARELQSTDEELLTGITGTVYVQFTIDKTGRVVKVKIMRGLDEALDNEVIRIVKQSPEWKPGKINDQPVNVSYVLPVKFTSGL